MQTVLGEIETCQYRNKSPEEIRTTLAALLKKHLHLEANSTHSSRLAEQRQKDHYSHFILRLAFARSSDLRQRFLRAETLLFKHRFDTDDASERNDFIDSLEGLHWEPVPVEERNALAQKLLLPPVPGTSRIGGAGGSSGGGGGFDETYYRVDWEQVPDLVERRLVLLRAGKAYVAASQRVSVVVAEFSARLERALELTARALPRLDEDDRLVPILNHLSLGFAAPTYAGAADADAAALLLAGGQPVTAAAIDGLTQHFPACMLHLHRTLRRNSHLKHFGRLQYTLFLKGVGLSVDEALTFWRTAFSDTPSDRFDKEYRYNVRHAYGLEGSGKKYRAKSCHQILLENQPGPADAHGCPYRHFSADNLVGFLTTEMGVDDPAVLRGVRTDLKHTKFHAACNRVFEYLHRDELRREKERDPAATNETLIHPNEHFVRSWELRHPEAVGVAIVGGGAGTRRAGERVEIDVVNQAPIL